jgi:hypothetical protein
MMRIAATVLLSCALLALACGGDDGGPTDPNPNPEPDLGHIQVSTTTSGADLDPDGYTVAMPGAAGRPIGLNGVTTFSDVEVGTHQVELSGLADNCSANGSNPATAAVTKDATVQVGFDVECEAFPIGSVEVTTSVTNNFDPDGFQVLVAGASQGTVDVNGSATFDDLPDGMQQVELTGIAPNCQVDGENPVTVAIPTGGTAAADFSITCASPPEGRIALVAPGGIHVMNPDGSGKFMLFPCPTNCWNPHWSPDGSRIVFQYWENNWVNLYAINKDGSGFTRLTQVAADEDEADWSPDGTRIVFGRNGAIHVMNADGSAVTRLSDPPAGYWDGRPDWSPDGTSIAFTRQLGPGNDPEAIFLMDADGSNVREVTTPAPILGSGVPAYKDGDPAWSPDGSVIAFHRVTDADGSYRIHIVSPDGTGLTDLTPGLDHWAMTPSWSPDGTRIVFYGGSQSIYTMNADGSGVTEIGSESDPAWYPDWGP